MRDASRRALILGALSAGGLLAARRMQPAPPAAAASASGRIAPGAASASILDFVRDDGLRAAIAAGTADADLSATIEAAFAAAATVHFPAGTYPVGGFRVPAGRTLATDGRRTVFRQRERTRDGTRMISVQGSDVTIQDFTGIGRIRTSGGEQNHVLFIQANAATGDLARIRIGRVWGIDVRGDVLYVGAVAGYALAGLRFDAVDGVNVYRNVVSITGGSGIRGGAVTGSRVGYQIFDIEPEASYAPVTNVRIGSVRGGCVQIAAASPRCAASDIAIATLRLSPAFQANSSPPYPHHDVDTAVRTRNCANLAIGALTVRGFSEAILLQIFNRGELDRQSISIGRLEGAVGRDAGIRHAGWIEAPHAALVSIGGGTIDLGASRRPLLDVRAPATRVGGALIVRGRLSASG